MGNTVKSFFQSFSEIPEGKFPPEYYTPRLLRAIVLNYGNIIAICLILASIGYIYYRAAISAEEKLEQEHQKTHAALIERNQALMLLNQELADAADYVRTILPKPIIHFFRWGL